MSGIDLLEQVNRDLSTLQQGMEALVSDYNTLAAQRREIDKTQAEVLDEIKRKQGSIAYAEHLIQAIQQERPPVPGTAAAE